MRPQPFFFLQFTPASVKLVHLGLSVVHFFVGNDEARAVAGNGRVFELGALGLQQFLGGGDALFDAGILARFQIREFGFCLRSRTRNWARL